MGFLRTISKIWEAIFLCFFSRISEGKKKSDEVDSKDIMCELQQYNIMNVRSKPSAVIYCRFDKLFAYIPFYPGYSSSGGINETNFTSLITPGGVSGIPPGALYMKRGGRQ
jgi:hypothetical protein